ncbi:MAG: hypothetical protein JSV52_09355 [Candidatus Zixiibacteriota bacterium]|nr:MAG: hypothetical protein JSV52_09355 [candidate division Zixibacteria bacterium]
MMRKSGYVSEARISTILMMVLSISALALLPVSCGDNGIIPSNDSESQGDFFDLPFDGDALSKRGDIVRIEESRFDSRLSADDGGVVPLHDVAEVQSFVVLPESFLADTTFTVAVSKIITTDGSTSFVYEFGPDGLVFSQAAVLRINVAALFGPNVSSIKFYGLNEQIGRWVYLDTYEADDEDMVYALVEHFSSYGTGTGTGVGTK